MSLPVCWINVGDSDLFYQEACDYAACINTAGVKFEFKIVVGATYGFELFAPNAAIVIDFYAFN